MRLRTDIPFRGRLSILHSSSRMSTEAFGEIEYLIKDALTAIRVIDPNAIVAGGACRNAVLGLPINDIDIYMHLPAGQTSGSLEERLAYLGFTEIRRAEQADDSPYESMPNIACVYKCLWDGFPVDIIGLTVSTFNGGVNDFCVNVSKCWYAGGDFIHIEPAALHDINTNTITIPNGSNCPRRYLNKLVQQLGTTSVNVLGTINEGRIPATPLPTLDMFVGTPWGTEGAPNKRHYEGSQYYLDLIGDEA